MRCLPELLGQQLVLTVRADLPYHLQGGITDPLDLRVPVVQQVQQVRSDLRLVLDMLATGRVTAQLVEDIDDLRKNSMSVEVAGDSEVRPAGRSRHLPVLP